MICIKGLAGQDTRQSYSHSSEDSLLSAPFGNSNLFNCCLGITPKKCSHIGHGTDPGTFCNGIASVVRKGNINKLLGNYEPFTTKELIL